MNLVDYQWQGRDENGRESHIDGFGTSTLTGPEDYYGTAWERDLITAYLEHEYQKEDNV